MLPQQGVGILCQADEKKLPHSASACRDEATDLAGVEQLSSQSFLLSRLPLFCSFDKGSSLFCSVPIDQWVLVWDREGKKKTQGTHHHVILCVPDPEPGCLHLHTL